jgi:hypothetical protein
MRLIPVCKSAAAFRTMPQGSAFVPGGAAHYRQR